MKDNMQLRKELHQAGAEAAEIDTLVPLAARLSVLNKAKLAAAEVPKKSWSRILKPVSLAASGLAVGMFLIIIAQAASPTSPLYPLQKFSDAIVIDLHPEFRSTVMMKRAQQVNQLVATHASSKKILATLADYSSEASAYKSMSHTSYAAFEYCKSNLQQAAVSAPTPVHAAIIASLNSLGNS